MVLVVTADYLRGEMIAKSLGDKEVCIAKDAFQALDALDGAKLVFLDYALPAVNGAALLHELASDKELAKIPIVLMADVGLEIDMETYNIDEVLPTREATPDRVRRLAGRYVE
ncbi:hypothetical protein FWC63_02385 [Candidatus Saccharibacteria bacterium]|nr:hypothetical protein [Candidatus Saccharibacteria bacterium]